MADLAGAQITRVALCSTPDPEHAIDKVTFTHWEHPTTAGVLPGYWREPATWSYRVELRGRVFRIKQRDRLADPKGAVRRWRAWLDNLR